MSEFALYPIEERWWSFNDYRTVVTICRRLCAETVLEFGPGSSTLALIEGGAMRVDACEDDQHWMRVWRNRLAPHLSVELFAYTWADPLVLPAIDGRRYDLALIDGPRETAQRGAVLEYCLQRCAAVLVPLEEGGDTPYLRPRALAAAERHNCDVELIESGPLAGAFALLT